MDIRAIHEVFLKCTSLSIDTRKILPGALFVAIKGEHYDANTFAAEALAKGALFVIIDNIAYHIDQRTIVVDDSLSALQALAKYHRTYLGIPIIALTGSNGKTTTKELIHCVLSTTFNFKATIGNLKNHIGVPLTLLSFTNETEIGIVEMGANHQKEIEILCEMAMPDYGYITNFGKAHLEGFGGVEGVIKGKSELYRHLLQKDKIAVVNLDDEIQVDKSRNINRFSFSVEQDNADITISQVSADPFVTLTFCNVCVRSQLIGQYNATNIMAAIAFGKFFKVKNEKIRYAIEGYMPENNRSQLLRKVTNTIILDAYNANPSSMAAAIENLRYLPNSYRIAVLGDMFELGSESIAEHANIIALAINDPKTRFMFVGKDFYFNKIDAQNLSFYESFDNLVESFQQLKPTDSLILIKGSRGMALERILDHL